MAINIENGRYWDEPWKLVDGCTKVSPGGANCWNEQQTMNWCSHTNEKIKACALEVAAEHCDDCGEITDDDLEWSTPC